MDRNKQKEEAIIRLNMLKTRGLLNNVVDEFEKSDLLYYSEDFPGPFKGILYWVKNNEDYVKAVKDFESEYNCLVYHCILDQFEFGTVLSMLYVSDTEDEWEAEREDLTESIPIAYCYNFDEPYFSEFGSIHIAMANGGITRIG